MEDKTINSVIKKRLQEYESPINLDVEWQALLHKQNATKKHKNWYRLTSLFLLLGLVALFFYFAKDKDSHQISQPLEKSEQIASSESAESLLSIGRNEIAISKTANESRAKSGFQKTASLPKQDASLGRSLNLEGRKKGVDQTQKISNNEMLKTSSFKKPETKEIAYDDLKDRENINAIYEKILPVIETRPIDLLAVENNIFKNIAHELIHSKLGYLPSFKNKEDKNAIEIFVGMGLLRSRQKFSTKKDDFKVHKNQREEFESPLETYFFDVGINYYLKSKVFVGTSINYVRWYDEFKYSYERDKDYLLENVLLKKIIHQPSGEEEKIFGDTIVTGKQKVNITHFNKYTSTNLSLNIGYNVMTKSRFSIGVAGGLEWNLFSSSEGKIVSPDIGMGILEINNPTPVYKRSFGIGLTGVLNLSYHITDRFALQFRPMYSYVIPSITEKSYGLDANLSRYGCVLGLKYRL